jgi:putative methionine-R-sulfoxide reductase with GAF domain
MSEFLQDDSAARAVAAEQALRTALADGFRRLLTLPRPHEEAYRAHARQRAATLVRQSIYGLIALYLLVVVPIYLLGTDDSIGIWITWSMLPVGLVLGGMWLCSRLRNFTEHVETVLGISLFVSLGGTVYCAMLLGTAFFGQMASYICIYILIIAFSILQLPPRFAVFVAAAACLAALVASAAGGRAPYWLQVMLYFGVPLMITAVNGFMLELSERRNFVQNLLLNAESGRLAQLRQASEQEMQRQQRTAEFLSLIAGNPSLDEVFARTLRFLVTHTEASVAAGYLLDDSGYLHRIGTWAGDAGDLPGRTALSAGDTLMGPALQRREILCLDDVPPHYLPIRLGMATLRPAALMIVPVFQGEQTVGVVELGKLAAFGDRDHEIARAIVTPFAFAIIAAGAREAGVHTAAAQSA